MTPQDIAGLAEMWRAENPDKRAFAVLTLDRETDVTAMQIEATAQEIMVMLLTMFSRDPLYLTATKHAIELFDNPNIQTALKNGRYDTEKGINPKNIKS